MDAPTVQQPMQTGWMSFNPYQAQQQAQMEEYMRQQQLLELQRQVRRARTHICFFRALIEG